MIASLLNYNNYKPYGVMLIVTFCAAALLVEPIVNAVPSAFVALIKVNVAVAVVAGKIITPVGIFTVAVPLKASLAIVAV